jgi:hypothetical protein
MFRKCKKLLAEWLEHSQRNSRYMCNEEYSEAFAELETVESKFILTSKQSTPCQRDDCNENMAMSCIWKHYPCPQCIC